MKARIMVPVNGQRDADRIVPLLQGMVDHGEVGEAVLVRVEQPAPASVADFALDYADVALADAAKRAGSEAFLRGVAERIRWGSASYGVVALLGDEADALARFAKDRGFDSVLMVSREQSRLSRLFLGSAFDRVLAAVCVPVTVLRGKGCASELRACA
jgi:nucleotide-binding universal stress UspA family protein